MNGSPSVPSRTMSGASIKGHLTTGFRRSERSWGNGNHEMLAYRMVGRPGPSTLSHPARPHDLTAPQSASMAWRRLSPLML